MRNSEGPPVYSQIALDIAVRIARGDLKENARIPGRSLMAGEYHVSPETIRRSFQILADMKIIEVTPSSGSIVISRENAASYIEKYNIGKDFRSLRHELRVLMNERDTMNTKIIEIIDHILDISERFRNTNPLLTMEFEIPAHSPLVGKSVSETNFWHQTGATIVAIKREGKMIISPGPYAVFCSHDIIIVTGDTGVSRRIDVLISQ
ncbi:MAG: TrkA C-terminal domain-containing protein [Saccharofermentanales bacterium]